ncbi:MAG: lytic transglycosylase domain-containing protein [Myxococcales bacterium FL481]|nr:MAG: lytic transglycosylase domain-containing protein [Myxococcales bacterium FL481]
MAGRPIAPRWSPFWRRLAVGLGAVGLGLVAPTVSGEGGQSYYRYRDANGVLHITNVPRGDAKWKLWRRFPGSGGDRAGHAASKRKASNSSERARRYDGLIREASERYELPPALVRAVMRTESNFHPTAVSSAGAMGLMQLMPSTARFLGVSRPFEPRQNVMGGAKFLRLLANRFDGDMVLVLAGYHAGAGAVQKYGGVPPYESTRAYVKAVLRRYYRYARPKAPTGQTGDVRRRTPARFVAE